MRTLIVDDDFTSRRLLLKCMESIGECDSACNGAEAWTAFLDAHKEGRPYEMILLDIMMPEMDGREVLKRIREFESSQGMAVRGARIAMATTLSDRDSVISSFHDQCDGYITKPYNRDTLMSSLRQYGIYPAA